MALSSLSPASAFAGTGPLSLSVNGVNFNAGSVVQWNGSMLATTFVSSSQLTTIAPASLTDTAGSPSITVVFGQVSSNAVALAVVAPYNVSPSPAMLTVAAPGGAGKRHDNRYSCYRVFGDRHFLLCRCVQGTGQPKRRAHVFDYSRASERGVTKQCERHSINLVDRSACRDGVAKCKWQAMDRVR